MRVTFDADEVEMLDSVNASTAARRVIAYAKGIFNGQVVSVKPYQEHDSPSHQAQCERGPSPRVFSSPSSSFLPSEEEDAQLKELSQDRAIRRERQEKLLARSLPLFPTESNPTDR